jgi:hypothetical protein
MAKRRTPSYCLHKPTGQAYVCLNGKHHYLGKYGSDESRAEYDRKIEDFLSGGDVRSDIKISALCLAFWKHAQGYYVKDGKPTDEQAGIKSTLRRLRKRFGPMPVGDFRPRHLRELMEAMAEEGLTRGYVNQCAGRVKRMFAWGCERDRGATGAIHDATGAIHLRGGNRAPPSFTFCWGHRSTLDDSPAFDSRSRRTQM